MKKESVNFGHNGGDHQEKFKREDNHNKNEPSQLVLSIKNSVQQLRKLLEEKKARDAGEELISPSFNIPLNFHFKSIMELSQAIHNKFINNNNIIKTHPITHFPQEQEMFSVKDVAYCNGNGDNQRPTNLGALPVHHTREEARRISVIIEEYRENAEELQKARSEVNKLDGQILQLKEVQTQLDEQKNELTKVNSSAVVEGINTRSGSGSTSKQVDKESQCQSLKRKKSVWRLVRKTSGRVGFGILEALF